MLYENKPVGVKDVDSFDSKEEAFLVKHFHRGCKLYRVESDSFKLNNLGGVKWLFQGVLPSYRTDKPWMANYIALVPESISDLEFTCDVLRELTEGKEVSVIPAERLQGRWEHELLIGG